MKATSYSLTKENNLLLIVTFLTATLILANVSLPKINEHNTAVYEKQIKIKNEANGQNGQISFGTYSSHASPDFNGFLTLSLTALFLSLLLTKRIILSFLFAFLFFAQIIMFVIAVVPLKIDYYFFNRDLFELLSLVCLVSFSFWQAFALCRLAHRKFQAKISLR